MPKPALGGVRILAFELAVAGPFATHLLADMGAEVIKIERPGTGDVIRHWDSAVRGMSSGHAWVNRCKRSVTLNVKKPAGRAVLRRLAERCDVFHTNFAPGVLDNLDLGYEVLREWNPSIIYCAVSGYGLYGPYRDVKAFDPLTQGEAGLIATTGYPEAPAKVSIPISDIAAGMYAALGIMVALHQRRETGQGQLIDVSMFESILSWLGYFPHFYWHRGEEPERVGMRHHYRTPYGPFFARDGRYVNIAVADPANWEVFCHRVVERPDLLEDPRFKTSQSRREHREELERLVAGIFLERDSEEWIERMRAADLPYGEVRSIAEVLAHPQVAARGLIREIDSEVGRIPTIESALRLSESPVAECPLPALGADTDAVLQESGYSLEEIEQLRREGVL